MKKFMLIIAAIFIALLTAAFAPSCCVPQVTQVCKLDDSNIRVIASWTNAPSNASDMDGSIQTRPISTYALAYYRKVGGVDQWFGLLPYETFGDRVQLEDGVINVTPISNLPRTFAVAPDCGEPTGVALASLRAHPDPAVSGAVSALALLAVAVTIVSLSAWLVHDIGERNNWW